MAFSGPLNVTDRYGSFTPEDYVPIFKKMNVGLVVRLNKVTFKDFSSRVTARDILATCSSKALAALENPPVSTTLINASKSWLLEITLMAIPFHF